MLQHFINQSQSHIDFNYIRFFVIQKFSLLVVTDSYFAFYYCLAFLIYISLLRLLPPNTKHSSFVNPLKDKKNGNSKEIRNSWNFSPYQYYYKFLQQDWFQLFIGQKAGDKIYLFISSSSSSFSFPIKPSARLSA